MGRLAWGRGNVSWINQLATLLLVVGLMAACSPGPTSTSTPGGPGASQPAAAPQRTLVIIARGEPPSIAAKPLQAFSGSIAAPLRPFNAMLDYVDEREEAQPYL